jgi:hypothetical protein
MSRYLITIRSAADRIRASRWAAQMPFGGRVEFKISKRTLPQNDKMWSMLTDISTQLKWHGMKLNTEGWKLLFLDGLKREVCPVPNLDGTGFVNIGRSSSDLSKEEMSDMIELMTMFGANHGFQFHDQEAAA